MTDKEIIKALRCCTSPTIDCDECPLNEECGTLEEYALDLINRQQAEIEELELLIESLNLVVDGLNTECNTTKSEAIKEFINKFKQRCIDGGIFPAYINKQLELTAKEMILPDDFIERGGSDDR